MGEVVLLTPGDELRHLMKFRHPGTSDPGQRSCQGSPELEDQSQHLTRLELT